MTPAQYKKIDKIREDLEKIQKAVADKLQTARSNGDVDVVMECACEFGAIDTVLAAIESVG